MHLRSRLVCFAAVRGRSPDRTPCEMKTTLQPCMSHRPVFGNHLTCLGPLGTQFFRILKKLCQQLCMFSDAPSDWSSPRAISTLSHPSTLQPFRRSYFTQRVLSVHASVLLPHGEARCFWEKLEYAARLPATRYALLQPVFIPPQPDE